MMQPDPIQFIATARARAIDILVQRHGVRPYYRGMQIPTTLTFNYPMEFRSGRGATVSAEELRRFRDQDLLRREVTLGTAGQGQVTLGFIRLDGPATNIHLAVSIATTNIDAVGAAIASFLAVDANPEIPGAVADKSGLM